MPWEIRQACLSAMVEIRRHVNGSFGSKAAISSAVESNYPRVSVIRFK
jgi:hypothetical protein